MNNSFKERSLLSNTLDTFKAIIGYDLNSLKVVFEHQDDEIVFINEGWTGRVRVYLNGDLAYSGWDWTLMSQSSGWFLRDGKTYKVTSSVTNLLTFAQNLTLSIDGEIVATKKDSLYGKLKLSEIAHLAGGAALVGIVIAGVLRIVGL